MLADPGVRVRHLRAGGPGPLAKKELPDVLAEFTAELARAAAAERRRYDVLHAHYWLSEQRRSRSAGRSPRWSRRPPEPGGLLGLLGLTGGVGGQGRRHAPALGGSVRPGGDGAAPARGAGHPTLSRRAARYLARPNIWRHSNDPDG
ncbi:hypothetical protein [Kitasatospora sp. NPDC056531]|uniref:hypothetical protein n=1 Tax=Kitasatospora sp. NPDC056531 TaxID=3345856 RepID=UPI0036744EC4